MKMSLYISYFTVKILEQKKKYLYIKKISIEVKHDIFHVTYHSIFSIIIFSIWKNFFHTKHS